MIHQGSVRSTTKNEGTIYEMTLTLKTTRIILINNINNLFQQLARQSKAPQKVTNFFGDPALPAALKIKQVYKSLNKCGANKQAPDRRLVKVLCMRDLLYFHSHDIVGFTITEDVELTVEDEFVCICIRYSNCCCTYVSVYLAISENIFGIINWCHSFKMTP